MLVEKARYQGLDLRFWPPIDTGSFQPDTLPFAGLITLAIKGPGTSPEVMAEEQPTATEALNQAERTIRVLEDMDGGLDPELAADLRTNVIKAYLGGKFTVEAAQMTGDAETVDHLAAA